MAGALGVRTMEELIGRTDLLEILTGETQKQQPGSQRHSLGRRRAQGQAAVLPVERNEPFDKGELAEQMVADALRAPSKQAPAASSTTR